MRCALPSRRAATAAAAVVATVATASSTTGASTAAPVLRSVAARSSAAYVNPLAGSRWATYKGGTDGLFPAYQQASGARKRTLRKLALTPHGRWYTNFLAPNEIGPKINADLAQERRGHPNALVWMAMFRLWPQHESAKRRPLSDRAIAAYKRWVNNAARAIGSAHVAMVLEPDLPVTRKSWHPRVRLGLVRYAAQRFSALPRTTVYLDAGSADWLTVSEDVSMLRAAGIGYVHGFALGATHHTRTAAEIRYGRQVAMALAQAGRPNKHFIIDTSDNGHGYTWGAFYAKYPHGDYNDPPRCQTMTEHVCVSVGIPPTTNVTNPRWNLPSSLTQTLQRRCDAFVWIARPWLADNGRFFSLKKALGVVRSSPFFQ